MPWLPRLTLCRMKKIVKLQRLDCWRIEIKNCNFRGSARPPWNFDLAFRTKGPGRPWASTNFQKYQPLSFPPSGNNVVCDSESFALTFHLRTMSIYLIRYSYLGATRRGLSLSHASPYESTEGSNSAFSPRAVNKFQGASLRLLRDDVFFGIMGNGTSPRVKAQSSKSEIYKKLYYFFNEVEVWINEEGKL